nr:MAG TPA: hypothetical protein [Crassvirales sp.]
MLLSLFRQQLYKKYCQLLFLMSFHQSLHVPLPNN